MPVPKTPKAEPFPPKGFGGVSSLGALARGVGVGVPMLSMVLNGHRRPSASLLVRWAAFLGVGAERLWLMLYGEAGVVPKGSPVARRLAQERMPEYMRKGA